ncbi:hypothetical protein Droror1_Dr00011688 [Drosera rotundifolia]
MTTEVAEAATEEETSWADLRVLVVDDDPVCLKMLEKLLHQCKYHVTATNQAATALALLREQKFDIVISDVHMPDMDGFRLLELIGLELDLPVIMLSASDDQKLVLKGVRHGAVDYLVKPVRIHELRNIWQHVVRKNTLTERGKLEDGRDSDNRKEPAVDADLDEPQRRKRKDIKGEDSSERDDDNSSRDNEDSGTQKKQRVIWSKDLHDKFVSAIEELGMEKAFPKKILDLMKVDGLTREHVASHLQKYRMYLKKCSNGSSSQPLNMATGFGGNDFHNNFGMNRSLVELGRIRGVAPGASLYQPGGILGRLNTNAGPTLRSLASNPSPLLQPTTSYGPTFNACQVSPRPFQPLTLSANINANPLLHGLPFQQLHQYQQNTGVMSRASPFMTTNRFTEAHDAANMGAMPNAFPSNSFHGMVSTRMPNGIANNNLIGPSTNGMIANGTLSSFNIPARNMGQLDGFGSVRANQISYQDKYIDGWSGAHQSSIVPNSGDFNNGITEPLDNDLIRLVSSLGASRSSMHIQGDGMVQNQNTADHSEHPKGPEQGSKSIVHASTSHPLVPANERQCSTGLTYNRNFGASTIGCSNGISPWPLLGQNEVQNSESASKMRLDDEFRETLLAELGENRCESLEDIIGSIPK